VKRFFVSISCFLIIACSQEQVVNTEDTLLAKISDKKLYLSEIESLIPENSTKEDSNNVIRAYAENWAREAVILLEAEKRVAQDIDLDKLVKAYRESLLRHNFEKEHIEENLDSKVTDVQIETYYNENKDHFIVTDPLVKCWISKIDKTTSGLDKFKSNWKKGKKEKVKDFCEAHAEFHFLSDNWQYLSEVKMYFPEKLVSKLSMKSKSRFDGEQDGYSYFFYLEELIKAGEVTPLDKVKDSIRKLILHQRKTALLDKYKEDLYEKNLKNKSVEFYIQ